LGPILLGLTNKTKMATTKNTTTTMLGLDNDKTKTFLERNEKFRPVIEGLIAQTHYFTTEQIIAGVRSEVKKYCDERKEQEVPLVVITGENGTSGYWLYQQVLNLLPPHTHVWWRRAAGSPDLKGKVDILCIDDWSISGCQMVGLLQNHLYGVKDVSVNSYTIITCVATTTAIELVLQLCHTAYKHIIPFEKFQFRSNHIIPQIDKKLQEDELFSQYCEAREPDLADVRHAVHLEYKVSIGFADIQRLYRNCRADSGVPSKPY